MNRIAHRRHCPAAIAALASHGAVDDTNTADGTATANVPMNNH